MVSQLRGQAAVPLFTGSLGGSGRESETASLVREVIAMETYISVNN